MFEHTLFTTSNGMEVDMARSGEGWSRRRTRCVGWAKAVLLMLMCVGATGRALAQPFSSGSTGVNGSFPPFPAGTTTLPDGTRFLVWNMSSGLVRYCSQYDTNTQPETCTTEVGTAQIQGIPVGGLTNGVFNFTDVDVNPSPSVGILNIFLVGNANNSPLTILSQNSIHLGFNVSLSANGLNGGGTNSGLLPNIAAPGGRPGPGGFAGGATGNPGPPATDGSTGFGPAGGIGGIANLNSCSASPHAFGFNGGPSPVSATLTPLIGGSGGGGGGALELSSGCQVGRLNGGGGGGGGGAVLMAATSQISLSSGVVLYLYGGNGGAIGCGCSYGGGGAGGALRLVAPTLVSSSSSAYLYGGSNVAFGTTGAAGTVRIEGDASNFNLLLNGSTGTVVATPGAVTPANTPTLRITSVGDLTVPPTPSGNVNTPDVTFQMPPSSPVNVSLLGSNIPTGTTAKVRVTPQVGSATEVFSSAFVGSTASSTATASVTIPPGFGAITASATFACNGTICALLPSKDRSSAFVEVVAANGRSRAFIVKADGERIELSGGEE
jgi:hypothetical protein